MRWMKIVIDGKQRIDKWVIKKPTVTIVGADIIWHKDGPIFTTVGLRTRITLLRIAGK